MSETSYKATRDELGRVLCCHGRPFACNECGEEYAQEIETPASPAPPDATQYRESYVSLRTSICIERLEALSAEVSDAEQASDEAVRVIRGLEQRLAHAEAEVAQLRQQQTALHKTVGALIAALECRLGEFEMEPETLTDARFIYRTLAPSPVPAEET